MNRVNFFGIDLGFDVDLRFGGNGEENYEGDWNQELCTKLM